MSTSSETLAKPPAEKANGLATYLKVIYAPGEAFASLARVPTWGWAAIIGILLTVAYTLIAFPSTMHYQQIAQEHALSQMSADQAAQARAVYAKIPPSIYIVFSIVGGVIQPWFSWLVATVVLLIAAALGGGDARFKLAWAAAVNSYGAAGIGSLAGGIIVALRGPDAVNSAVDLLALPSLGMFVHGPTALVAFLYAYNIAFIWYYIITMIALEQTLKVGRGVAIGAVVILSLVIGGLLALFIR